MQFVCNKNLKRGGGEFDDIPFIGINILEFVSTFSDLKALAVTCKKVDAKMLRNEYLKRKRDYVNTYDRILFWSDAAKKSDMVFMAMFIKTAELREVIMLVKVIVLENSESFVYDTLIFLRKNVSAFRFKMVSNNLASYIIKYKRIFADHRIPSMVHNEIDTGNGESFKFYASYLKLIQDVENNYDAVECTEDNCHLFTELISAYLRNLDLESADKVLKKMLTSESENVRSKYLEGYKKVVRNLTKRGCLQFLDLVVKTDDTGELNKRKLSAFAKYYPTEFEKITGPEWQWDQYSSKDKNRIRHAIYAGGNVELHRKLCRESREPILVKDWFTHGNVVNPDIELLEDMEVSLKTFTSYVRYFKRFDGMRSFKLIDWFVENDVITLENIKYSDHQMTDQPVRFRKYAVMKLLSHTVGKKLEDELCDFEVGMLEPFNQIHYLYRAVRKYCDKNSGTPVTFNDFINS
jgi:hypothetical protein